MEDKDILLNHYDVLSAFHDDYYRDLITKAHLGEETVIKIDGEQVFVFPVKYKGKIYAIPSEIVDKGKMPIKIMASEKTAFNRNVYHFVTRYASARIIAKKTMSFRELVNTIGNFNHTKKVEDFTNFKIATLMLYLRKGFVRIVSEAAFGKNSIPNIVKILLTDVAIINPRSTAALEHKLINKVVVLDELTNLEKSQRNLMQEALLRIGDWSPSYEKSTRGSSKIGTKDEYDISKLSIMILYNVLEYYRETNQQDKYFDKVFQPAMKDRYLPLYFEGVLDTTQFIDLKNAKNTAKILQDEIKKLIRAVKYYEENLEKDIHNYKLHKEYKLSKTGRVDKTFQMICKGVDLYSKNEVEYNRRVDQLYKCFLKYTEMLQAEEVIEVELDAPLFNNKKSEDLGSFM